ncbi:hypothetical protein RDV79_08060 [Aeromonas dhakensis]|uniref:hypothetical protein n=1 Tax=Aeromonas dhakensis TaxID=196024 RepID=UPI002A80B0D7|nr:hypothetical protein [Aeromonas dhakensis]WPS58569.1 hypothetical protein RDV79_08060 [Aeromonas dhakensis]
MKHKWELIELQEQWWELGHCDFATEEVRSGGLLKNCETLALLQKRALKSINNAWLTIGQSKDWGLQRRRLTAPQARWCEASLCVQLVELSPDMRTTDKRPWIVGHQKQRGVKPQNNSDLITEWLRGIVDTYHRWVAEEDRIGLSIRLHDKESVYPSEIINAAKLLAKVKETEELQRAKDTKALLTSIEEAKTKFSLFGIGTRNPKEDAKWILLLADAWGLEPYQVSLAARSLTQRAKGQQ